MRNQYSISEFFSTAYALVLTKLFYKGARLVRRPVYMRGRNSLDFQPGLTTGHGCRFDLAGNKKTLFIGNNCEMGDYNHIVAHERVVLGNNVLIASKIFISDTNHGAYSGRSQSTPDVTPNDRPLLSAPVKIGNNVWIGENAVILPGTEIGDGCIVGANAVVKGKFESNTIIAGVPAKPVKQWDSEKNSWEKIL